MRGDGTGRSAPVSVDVVYLMNADHNGIIDCEEICNDFEDNDGDGTRNCDDRCPGRE